MNNLLIWARKHGLTESAIRELQLILMAPESQSPPNDGTSEAGVSQRVALAASRAGLRLFRNNVGACKDDRGRMIRYGLCNESKRVNKQYKSADQIGITPMIIKPRHVGRTVGIFTSIEDKHADWTFSGTEHEQGQINWANFVKSMGGIAKFATSDKVVDEILHEVQ